MLTLGKLGKGLGFANQGGGGVDERFIIKVDTTKAGSANDTMIIPTTGSGFDCTVDWGDGNSDSYSGTPGLTTIQHTYAAGGEKTIAITGTFPRIYFFGDGDYLKILEVVNWGNYGLTTSNQTSAFKGCSNLIKIAEDWKLDDVLTNGFYMFLECGLTSLPSNMTLASLTTGFAMFRYNGLTSLPDGIILPNLTDGRYMFGVTFGESGLTSISSSMTLAKLTDGTQLFINSTINTADYSALLVNMEANNVNTGVAFHGGNSKYNAEGEIARNKLLARDPAWTITDGGLAT